MVSVAQSIPPEIVCQVLKHLSAPLVFEQCAAQFPFYLGHICSAWRAAFLSMHSDFWSRIILRPPVGCTTQSRCTEMVKTFLERSQGRPLSFEIGRSLAGIGKHFLEMFIKESTRWKNIAFDVYRQDVQLLSLLKDRLPQLRSLALYSSTPKLLAGCEDIFENAPRLTHVRLNDPTNWRLPWQSLTVLHLCCAVGYDELVTDVLPHTANLEELFFDPAPYFSPTFPAVVITLPRLKRLFIFNTSILLSVIRTPLLEQTYFEDRWDDIWLQDPSEVCKAFFLGSSCPLRHLGLRYCGLEVLAAILSHTPDITSLDFLDPDSQDPSDFFRLLTCVFGEASLAPRLEALRLSAALAADNELARMIASRTTDRPARVQRLKQFRLQSWVEESEDHDFDIPNGFERECTRRDVQFRFDARKVSDIKSSYRNFQTHNPSELGLFDV